MRRSVYSNLSGANPSWLDARQTILAQFTALPDPSTTPKPWCLHGADPHGDLLPSEWCACGANGATTYSVASSTASENNPCPNTAPPGPTVSFLSASATKPTSNAASSASTSPAPGPPVCLTSSPYNMKRDYAVSVAKTYCHNEMESKTQVTSQWPGTCSVQNQGAVYQPPKSGNILAGQSDIVFSITQDLGNDYCESKQYSDLSFNEADCNSTLMQAIDGCKYPHLQTFHD